MQTTIRRALDLALALYLTAGTGTAGAQDFDRGVAFLTIPTGARLVGMGRAGTAVSGEFQGLRWNPAILSSVDGVAPLASSYDGPLDFRVNHFAVAVPVGAVGTLMFFYVIADWGAMLYRARDRIAGHKSESELLWAFVASMAAVMTIYLFLPIMIQRQYWLLYGLGIAAARLAVTNRRSGFAAASAPSLPARAVHADPALAGSS